MLGTNHLSAVFHTFALYPYFSQRISHKKETNGFSNRPSKEIQHCRPTWSAVLAFHLGG